MKAAKYIDELAEFINGLKSVNPGKYCIFSIVLGESKKKINIKLTHGLGKNAVS